MKKYVRASSKFDLGTLNEYYRVPDEDELDWGYDDDVESIMENDYGIQFLGWMVAKDEYYDLLANSGLEWGAIGKDETGDISLYLVAGDRVYDMEDEVNAVIEDSEEYDDEY